MNTINKSRETIILGLLLCAFGCTRQKTDSPQLQAANVVWSETEHDFGPIEGGGKVYRHAFTYKNEGKSPVVVNRIETSCHCTTAEYAHHPTPPGGEDSIVVSYDTGDGSSGRFFRTVTVYTNSDEGLTELIVKGTVGE